MVQRGIIILSLLFLLVHGLPAQADSTDDPVRGFDIRRKLSAHYGWKDTLEPVSAYILRNIQRFAPAGYIRQKQVRNVFQRTGYVNVVIDISASDGLSAFFQYVKMKLAIAYSMEHKEFTVWDMVPLPDDWNFPVDPWKKEWWMYR